MKKKNKSTIRTGFSSFKKSEKALGAAAITVAEDSKESSRTGRDKVFVAVLKKSSQKTSSVFVYIAVETMRMMMNNEQRRRTTTTTADIYMV
jgi:hypothetical protein